jgi:hypothetical protein
MRKLEFLDASIVSFNEAVMPAFDPAIPFGGRRSSGHGLCHGVEGLLSLSRPQSWVDSKPVLGANLFRSTWSGLLKTSRAEAIARAIRSNPLQAARSWLSPNKFRTEA